MIPIIIAFLVLVLAILVCNVSRLPRDSSMSTINPSISIIPVTSTSDSSDNSIPSICPSDSSMSSPNFNDYSMPSTNPSDSSHYSIPSISPSDSSTQS